jgi:uncharacterized membrane protein
MTIVFIVFTIVLIVFTIVFIVFTIVLIVFTIFFIVFTIVLRQSAPKLAPAHCVYELEKTYFANQVLENKMASFMAVV